MEPRAINNVIRKRGGTQSGGVVSWDKERGFATHIVSWGPHVHVTNSHDEAQGAFDIFVRSSIARGRRP